MNEIIRKIDEEIGFYKDLQKNADLEGAIAYQNIINGINETKQIIQAEQKDVCYHTKSCEFKIDKLCELGSPCPHQDEPKTNGDRIREMNNEELANWIFEKIEDTEWDEDGNNNFEDDIAEWLNEPVNERN